MMPRRPVQRAYPGLAGRPYEPEAAVAPAPDVIALVPSIVSGTPRKRGRPLTGTHKKTAAEIKRDQRKREREELDSVHILQQQQRLYDQARQRIEADLNAAIAAGDNDKIQEIRDIIQGQEEQKEYNAQRASAKKFRGGGGMFIANAPHGKGKIVYGGENIVAVGDKLATIDEDGDATFAPGQKVTAYHDGGGAVIQAEDVPISNEEEDKFHEEEHPLKWRRDPKRSQFDKREQEEKIFDLAGNFLEEVAVAIMVWDGENFSIVRNADEEIRCKLCGRSFRMFARAAMNHLVDDHARKIAPTSTKETRAKQKILTKALKEREIEVERDAAANGWRKVNGKWVKAN
jgi:hypothetical protein